MGKLAAWLQKWRTGIRLGETGAVLSLWTAGITASDAMIAQILLVAGLAIAIIAVLADPEAARLKSGLLIALVVLLFAGCEFLLLWHKASIPTAATKTIIVHEPTVFTNTVERLVTGGPPPAPRETQNYLIDVACEKPSPIDALPSRTYHVVSFFEGTNDVGIGTMSTSASAPVPSAKKSLITLICTVSNYGPLPLTDVRLPVEIKGNDGGGLTVRKTLLIERIAPRPDQGFVFYVQNGSQFVRSVKFRLPVSGRMADGSQTKSIRLSSGSAGPFYDIPIFQGLQD